MGGLNVQGENKILFIKPTCLLRGEEEMKFLRDIRDQIDRGERVILIPSIFEVHEMVLNREVKDVQSNDESREFLPKGKRMVRDWSVPDVQVRVYPPDKGST